MKKYVLSIDAGTTGVTLLLFDKNLNIKSKEYAELNQIYPKPTWVEHDPIELIKKIELLFNQIVKKYPVENIASIGITNQRESIVIWNKKTGLPIYNTIVWQCRRTKNYCKTLKDRNKSIFNKTGLYVDSYFSATKIKWILDNVKGTKKLLKDNLLLCGTIDTWIIWNLTKRKMHLTDHTNASRTLIYNINNKKWDDELLGLFKIPKRILPEVKNSIDDFGQYQDYNIPIYAVAGDQQAALFGQGCFKKNSSKCTYGTGLFFLLNTGKKRIDSKNKLLTTLAINNKGKPAYALEGSIFIGGALIQWLRDELELINSAEETDSIAASIKDTNGVHIIPAFVGLGAPYWNSDCKGVITGLTRDSNKKHIIRASLEAIAFQVEDLLKCISKDIKKPIKELYVDGGATNNKFLMQFQADISNLKIFKPYNIESTSLGAGIMSGLKAKIWKNTNEIITNKDIQYIYKPEIDKNERKNKIKGWNTAIKKI